MKRIFVAILILAAVQLPASAEELIRKNELLTLDRAVEIALRQHPNLLAGKGSVVASEARKGQAQAGYWPSLDAAVGYARIKPSSNSFLGLGSSDPIDQFSASVTARQMLYDFGKTTANVNIQEQNIEGSRADLITTEEEVIFAVKQAYFNLLRSRRNREVAGETVNQFMQHLEQAKAFYEVGTKPKFDVTKAEVDLGNARLNLIRAGNAVRLAVVSLNNAMGVPAAPEYTVEDRLSFTKYQVALDDAVERAYKNRPELKALTARRLAAEKAVYVAKTGNFPILTGNAGWSRSGETFDTDNGSWTAGVTFSIPIFSGFLTKHQIIEAEATLRTVAANEEALRQRVLLEVQQNYLSLLEAEERIVTTELTVRQAKENHEIATGRYAAGVGNPIEVTDAEVALSNAKAEHIQALYDYKVAAASLEKAMGIRQQ